ncbi:hypothetical protein AB0H12_19975 [Actinosynnema sp. NPDC023794]
MLVDPAPGDAGGLENPYGFNLTQMRGLANPAYYELMDHHPVKLYRDRRGLPADDPRLRQEDRWLEGFDDVMSTIVLETNTAAWSTPAAPSASRTSRRGTASSNAASPA